MPTITPLTRGGRYAAALRTALTTVLAVISSLAALVCTSASAAV